MKSIVKMPFIILFLFSILPSLGLTGEFPDLPALQSLKKEFKENNERPLPIDLNALTIQPSSLDAMIRMGIDGDDASRLGSGDIVGNGGGKAEADFNYTYKKLHKFISDCISTYSCMVNDRQRALLHKIMRISLINQNKKDKLIFIDEHLMPGFFNDENDPQVRVAKTGFEEDSPIFINLDIIYNHSTQLLDIPAIVAILIHEIGHQTGIKEHALLDDLGATVRNFLNAEKLQSKISVYDNSVTMTAFNFNNKDVYSELNLSYRGINLEFSTRVVEQAKCSKEGTELVGLKIENLSFRRTKNVRTGKLIRTRAWITLNCMSKDLSIVEEEKDLSVDFTIAKRFLPPGLIYTIENVTIDID